MNNTFAARLKQERERRGMSMREFSEEIGIALSSLAEYEAGRRIPRGDTIAYIAKKLRISPASLISDAPPEDQTFRSCLDSLSLKIHTLHPSTRASAKCALDQLFLALQMSDELFLLEKRIVPAEPQTAPFRYVLHESSSLTSSAPLYGILVEELRDDVWTASAMIAPFSSDRIAVLNVISSANTLHLPPDRFFSDAFPAFFPLL